MINSHPDSDFEATTQAFAHAAAVFVRVRDDAGGDAVARTNVGVVEDVTVGAQALFRATLTAPATAGRYQIVWDDGVTLDSEELVVSYTAAGVELPDGRDLCTLADVTSYVPAYQANDATDAKLQQLISAESQLIHDECGREIVAKGAQPATRKFEISTKSAQLRQIEIGDLRSISGLAVSILNWDGTVNRTVDVSAIVGLYEGEWQPTRDWEPITSLYFPWGRAEMPVFIPLQALQVVGTFGFPQIPGFIREACAKRVIVRYVSDVAHVGTEFANAVEDGNLNLAAMFNAAEDAIAQLSGRVVLA